MARFDPIKELAIGVVDGVNRVFKTPIPYVSNTVIPYRNGQARPETVITELPGNQYFEFEFAPIPGDEISVYYVQLI